MSIINKQILKNQQKKSRICGIYFTLDAERSRYRSVHDVHKVSGPPTDKLLTDYLKLKIMI